MARSHIRREGPGHTLQATALVHEVYLRLVGIDHLTLNDRTHFFAVAATLMRQILVDHARRKRADKRGGGVTMMSLDEVSPVSQTSIVDVLALDQALDALSSRDARQCHVVELRFFAGLSIDETAEAIGRIGGHGRARMGDGESVAASAIVGAAVARRPSGAMSADTWSGNWLRLKDLFEKARALPTESRPAYLAAACHDNPALRLEVEELLASHERARTFLERPIVLLDESMGRQRPQRASTHRSIPYNRHAG